jgi:hypothetical protein
VFVVNHPLYERRVFHSGEVKMGYSARVDRGRVREDPIDDEAPHANLNTKLEFVESSTFTRQMHFLSDALARITPTEKVAKLLPQIAAAAGS